MLVPPTPDHPLEQGDVIRDVPFLVLPKTFNVKAEGVAGQSRVDSGDPESLQKATEFSQGKPLAAAAVPLVLQPGMIVTQGCDIDFKDTITLARIFPLVQMIQDVKDAVDGNEPVVLHEIIRRLTEGQDSPNLVYLGNRNGLGLCVAELMRVQSFPQQWKDCFIKTRWMSLTPEGLKYAQGRLNLFTGRFALDQGFWHAAGDKEIAERLAKHPEELQQARDRLASRKNPPSR